MQRVALSLPQGDDIYFVLASISVASSIAGAAADLVPAKVKLYIFYGMPKKTKLKTILAPLCGQSPEQVMAPAVADSHKLGYDKLYRLLLDHVSHVKMSTSITEGGVTVITVA